MKSGIGAIRFFSRVHPHQAASDARLARRVQDMKNKSHVADNMKNLAEASSRYVTQARENGDVVTTVSVEDFKEHNVSHEYDPQLKMVHVYAHELRAPRQIDKLYAPVPILDGVEPEDIEIRKKHGKVTVIIPEVPSKKKK